MRVNVCLRGIFFLFVFVSALLAACTTIGVSEAAQGTQDIHVNVASTNASDYNPGTEAKPLATIGEGLHRALDNRQYGIATQILIHPGTYRENLVDQFNNSRGPTITFKATEPGKAIISGSDRWTDWQDAGGDVYTHTWPYNWGTDPNPWPNDVTIGELARRRELVFVNNTNLNQALSRTDLSTGSFYVDENANIIYMEPPAGTDMSTADVEVGVRGTLYDLLGLQDVVIKGLVFQHAVSEFQSAAVNIGSNTLVENTVIRWNGQNGLYLEGKGITLRTTVMNRNGGDGIAAYKARNLLMENTETSYNNWRGDRGGFHGWGVGQKFARIHGALIRNHRSVGNLSNGFWLDWDNEDITIEGMYSCDNLVDGLRIEASQGPITVKSSTFCHNGQIGLSANGSDNVTLSNNQITGNSVAQISITPGGRGVRNWETGEQYNLNLENWKVLGNTMKGTNGSFIWRLRFWNSAIQQRFFETSTINHNSYAQPNNNAPFHVIIYGNLTFAEWQAKTGKDEASTFTNPDSLKASNSTRYAFGLKSTAHGVRASK